MKARQKWDLLVINSKGFVNFVMSNLRNFKKFSTLKNVKKLTFSIWKKNTRFSHKISFCHYFYYLTCFEMYTMDAAWKTESNKCISKHVR